MNVTPISFVRQTAPIGSKDKNRLNMSGFKTPHFGISSKYLSEMPKGNEFEKFAAARINAIKEIVAAREGRFYPEVSPMNTLVALFEREFGKRGTAPIKFVNGAKTTIYRVKDEEELLQRVIFNFDVSFPNILEWSNLDKHGNPTSTTTLDKSGNILVSSIQNGRKKFASGRLSSPVA